MWIPSTVHGCQLPQKGLGEYTGRFQGYSETLNICILEINNVEVEISSAVGNRLSLYSHGGNFCPAPLQPVTLIPPHFKR